MFSFPDGDEGRHQSRQTGRCVHRGGSSHGNRSPRQPGRPAVGDSLHLQVLFDGKPFSGEVFATYAGFSNDEGTFAYATSTDKKGNARIRILHQGIL